MNLYGYANGDPVNYADPFGLYAERQGGDESASSDDVDLSRQIAEAGKKLWEAALAKFGIGVSGELITHAGSVPIQSSAQLELHAGPVSVSFAPDATNVAFGTGTDVAALATFSIGTLGTGGPGTITVSSVVPLGGPFVGYGAVHGGGGGKAAVSFGAGVGASPIPRPSVSRTTFSEPRR